MCKLSFQHFPVVTEITKEVTQTKTLIWNWDATKDHFSMWLWTDVAETNNFYSSLNVVILNSLLVSHWIRVHVCGYQLDVHIHHTQSIQDFKLDESYNYH